MMERLIYSEPTEIGTVLRAVTAELGYEHIVSRVAQLAFTEALGRKQYRQEPWRLVITHTFRECVVKSLETMAANANGWDQANAAYLLEASQSESLIAALPRAAFVEGTA